MNSSFLTGGPSRSAPRLGSTAAFGSQYTSCSSCSNSPVPSVSYVSWTWTRLSSSGHARCAHDHSHCNLYSWHPLLSARHADSGVAWVLSAQGDEGNGPRCKHSSSQGQKHCTSSKGAHQQLVSHAQGHAVIPQECTQRCLCLLGILKRCLHHLPRQLLTCTTGVWLGKDSHRLQTM